MKYVVFRFPSVGLMGRRRSNALLSESKQWVVQPPTSYCFRLDNLLSESLFPVDTFRSWYRAVGGADKYLQN